MPVKVDFSDGRRGRPALLKERARNRIRDMIIRGELPGGMWLSDVRLAKQLKIGRTPIREALHLLGQSGLVEWVGANGPRVREFGVADVVPILEVRRSLQCLAARLAVQPFQSLKDLDLDDFERRFLELKKQGQETSVEQVSALSREFHLYVVEAAGNPHLLELIQVLWPRNELVREFVWTRCSLASDGAEMIRKRWEDHFAIIQALRRRDGSGAERLTHQYFGNVIQNFLQVLWPAGNNSASGWNVNRDEDAESYRSA